MFIVFNGHHEVTIDFFRIFQKIEFLLVWRPFLGQNLPQISYFHKIGRGFTSGRNKKWYLAQNGELDVF